MDNLEHKATHCTQCGVALASGELDGLCPRCLMALSLSTDADLPGGQVNAAGTRPAPAPPEAIARCFPQLEILECLGRGGMGAVYKARQPLLQRCVALKILAPEKEKEPRFAERFTREAQALARLNHPNIVTVYDFGETNGLYYLLMEYVDGMSLRQLLQQRKLPPAQALAIVPAICDALQYAHQQGIVHRDIKPENVLLDQQGRVKIADFGIAKLLDPATRAPALTDATEVVGTAYYMAPEQVESPQSVDHRADIYSLGVVFYEMLTGELPLGKFAPPSSKAQSDVRLDEVVLRALEKEPARRYQQVRQVKSDVESIATHTGPAAGQALSPGNEARAETPGASADTAGRAAASAPKAGRRKEAILLCACGLGLLAFLLGLFFFLPHQKDFPLYPWSVAFLPDGQTLVSGGGQRWVSPTPMPGELVFWNLASGKRRVLRQDWGIRALACSRDGKFLAVGQANGLTRLAEPQTGKTLLSLTPSAFVHTVAVSADSQMVASGSFDGTVTLWDVSRRQQETLVLPNEVVLGVGLAPDHSALVATTRSGKAYLFNLAQRGEPRVLAACPTPGDDANAEAVAFAPESASFATVCQRSVRLWDTASGKLVREWQSSGNATFLGLAFAPDGHSLATVDSDGVLTLWNPQTGESLGNVKAHEANSYTVVFSPDGKRLATTGNGDYTIKLWDAQTLAPVKSLVRAAAPAPKGVTGKAFVQQQEKAASQGDYWAKYRLWEAYHKGSQGVKADPAQAEKWLQQFVIHVSLVKFEPVNGFNPANGPEFLDRIQQHSPVYSDQNRLGMGGFFRTTKRDGKLIGSFLTNYPEQLKALLERNPYLKVLSVEEVTPQQFLDYEQTAQESL